MQTNMDDQNILAPLAHAVRSRRRALNLTQAQVSDLAGVGPVFVHHLETGKPTLQFQKILDVLAVLGLGLAVDASRTPLRVTDGLSATLERDA